MSYIEDLERPDARFVLFFVVLFLLFSALLVFFALKYRRGDHALRSARPGARRRMLWVGAGGDEGTARGERQKTGYGKTDFKMRKNFPPPLLLLRKVFI